MSSNSGEGRRVKVQDRRRVGRDEPAAAPPPADDASVAEEAGRAEGEIQETAAAQGQQDEPATEQDPGRDYLDDLRRLQADFDNYRKRMMREQTALTARATESLVERLLPVLDNFERAVGHGAPEGVALVYRQLRDVLVQEGLEEIPAEGVPFDPSVHEAVELKEDAGVAEPTCTSVLRRGYRLGHKLLRAAMVSVAHPAETEDDGPSGNQQTAIGEG